MSAPELVIRAALWQNEAVDLLVTDGRIQALLACDENNAYEGSRHVDADGLTLLPALIDIHTHLREPGHEYKEEIRTGLAAAAHGGFGAVFAMANTSPINDNATITRFMLDQAAASWPHGPRLHPVGALTRGLDSSELAPMAELTEAGCIAFSNDGLPLTSAETLRRGMEYAADLGRMVIDHCEEPGMARAAGINESALSGRLGLKGQPTVAESIQVARDILLAEYLNLPIHLAHISCRQSVELIAWAKARGVPVSAETCPHYLLFTEDAVADYSTAAKVNPPLRARDDVLALRQALRTGVIDVLATDHAPHAAHEKEVTFAEAPCGISGLDSALSLTWGLVADGELDSDTLLRAWCYRPAELFNLPVNRFNPGDPADFALFDAQASRTLTARDMFSKGKNTPCLDTTLRGRVQALFLAGRSVL